MGVFGNRGQARARKRVQDGLAASAAWQVAVGGKGWVCPFCAQAALDALPDKTEARVDAVLEHLEGACPGWKGGEGAERPLADMKKTAALRELRRRTKTELVQNPAWQLIDATRQWYCPYCGEGTSVLVSADKRMTEDVLMAIVGHVDGCYAHRHGQSEKPLAHLKAIVKYSNQSRRLAENVRKKLEGDPAWRRKDARSRWVCPYCLQSQEHVDLSSNLLMFENAPRLIAKHLAAACAEFKAGAQPKPLEAPERTPTLVLPPNEPLGLVARPSGRLPKLTPEPRDAIPDTDPAGVASRKRDSVRAEVPPQKGRSGRLTALDPVRVEQQSSSGKLPLPVDSGKLPALPDSKSDAGRVEKKNDAWGRDGLVAATKGTTLRDLESSGELLLIDDPDVRKMTARTPDERPGPSRQTERPSERPSERMGGSETGSAVRSTGRRPASEWRREIEAELARVKSLAPAGSGEHMPPLDLGSEEELRSLSKTLRFVERRVEVRRLLLPASAPRGDFIDLRDLGGDQLGVVAGGVLGDEPEGPLVAAMARNMARQALVRDADPGAVLRRTNGELFPDLDGRVYVALLCGIIDMQRLTFTVARAGMSAPLMVNPARPGQFGVMQTEGMIMGIDRGPIFDSTLETRTFDLARGDQLVLFTNGLAEARGPTREEFGIERMHNLARRYGGHEADYFTDKFREYFDLFMQDPTQRSTDVVVAAIKWGA